MKDKYNIIKTFIAILIVFNIINSITPVWKKKLLFSFVDCEKSEFSSERHNLNLKLRLKG